MLTYLSGGFREKSDVIDKPPWERVPELFLHQGEIFYKPNLRRLIVL